MTHYHASSSSYCNLCSSSHVLLCFETAAVEMPYFSRRHQLECSIGGSRDSSVGSRQYLLVRAIVEITGFGRATDRATLWCTTKLCRLFKIFLLPTLWWHRWKTHHLQQNMPVTSDPNEREGREDTDCYKLYETVYLVLLYIVLTVLYWTASTFAQVCLVASVSIMLVVKQCTQVQKRIEEYFVKKRVKE